jgi:hypothetical protein
MDMRGLVFISLILGTLVLLPALGLAQDNTIYNGSYEYYDYEAGEYSMITFDDGWYYAETWSLDELDYVVDEYNLEFGLFPPFEPDAPGIWFDFDFDQDGNLLVYSDMVETYTEVEYYPEPDNILVGSWMLMDDPSTTADDDTFVLLNFYNGGYMQMREFLYDESGDYYLFPDSSEIEIVSGGESYYGYYWWEDGLLALEFDGDVRYLSEVY